MGAWETAGTVGLRRGPSGGGFLAAMGMGRGPTGTVVLRSAPLKTQCPPLALGEKSGPRRTMGLTGAKPGTTGAPPACEEEPSAGLGESSMRTRLRELLRRVRVPFCTAGGGPGLLVPYEGWLRPLEEEELNGSRVQDGSAGWLLDGPAAPEGSPGWRLWLRA
jgi:hypothetical protein